MFRRERGLSAGCRGGRHSTSSSTGWRSIAFASTALFFYGGLGAKKAQSFGMTPPRLAFTERRIRANCENTRPRGNNARVWLRASTLLHDYSTSPGEDNLELKEL